jgi:hypothetical protein
MNTSLDEMIAHHRALIGEYAAVVNELHALGAADPYTPRDTPAHPDYLALAIGDLEAEIQYLRRVIATPNLLAEARAAYANRHRPRCHYCGLPTRRGICDECGTEPM